MRHTVRLFDLSDLKKNGNGFKTLPEKFDMEAERETRIEYLEQVRRAEMTKIKALEKYIDALKRLSEDFVR